MRMNHASRRNDDQAVKLLSMVLDEFAQNGRVMGVHCDVCLRGPPRAERVRARLLALASAVLREERNTGIPAEALYTASRLGLPSDPAMLSLVPSRAFKEALLAGRAAGITDLSESAVSEVTRAGPFACCGSNHHRRVACAGPCGRRLRHPALRRASRESSMVSSGRGAVPESDLDLLARRGEDPRGRGPSASQGASQVRSIPREASHTADSLTFTPMDST
jgi:hypothetical protein